MHTAASLKSAARGRAARPGPSGVRGILLIGVFVVLVAALGAGIYGMADTHHAYVGYVPPPGQQKDRILVGTLARPALTIEGDYVQVKTPGFSALAVVNGPVVPGEGLPNQMSFTTCTWTISISHVVGRVPIAAAEFDSITHTGAVYKPYVVPGQPRLPTVLLPGHRLTFELRAVMPVGEGLMRWAPDGNNIVAKWDYQVEND